MQSAKPDRQAAYLKWINAKMRSMVQCIILGKHPLTQKKQSYHRKTFCFKRIQELNDLELLFVKHLCGDADMPFQDASCCPLSSHATMPKPPRPATTKVSR